MYRSFFVAGGTIALLSALPSMAQDFAPDSLVTEATMPLLRVLVEEVGGEVIAESDDSVQIEYTADNGLTFGLAGTACEGEGTTASCKGLFITGRWTAGSEAYSLERLNAVDNQYAAVNISRDDNGGALLSRYLILDHGQTVMNLVLNVRVTQSIGKSFNDLLLEDDPF